MTNTQKLYRYIAPAFAAVFAVTILFTGLRPEIANAAPYSKDTLQKRAEAWMLGSAVAKCIESEGFNKSGHKDEDINNGQWLTGDANVGEWAADLAEGESKDAKASCEEQVAPAVMNAIESNGVETVCGMNEVAGKDYWKRDKTQADCVNGTGELDFQESSTAAGKRYSSQVWNDFFRDAYLEGKGIKESLTDGMRYIIYWENFWTECSQDHGKGWKISSWNDATDKTDDYTYKIKAKRGGKVSGDFFKMSSSGNKSSDGIDVGGAWLNFTEKDNDTCGELAKKINTHADAYIKEVGDLAKVGIQDDNLSTDAGGDNDSCESAGGMLSFITCPVLYALDGGIGFLNEKVEGLLDVDESTYKSDSVEGATKNFRNLALLLLVPMMMFMVIGTALNFGPFDPYTVKKALPRMFVAVIFIALSLPITQFFIELSNVAGKSISGLVLSASNAPFSLTDAYGAGEGFFITALTGLGAAGAGFAAVTLGGVGGALVLVMLSFALVTFVGLMTGFVILILRELLISALVIMAPLAILVWIFPGNDKFWGIWKNTFIALLMMFPIIMLLIASGKVFAGIIDETQGGLVAFFMKITAIILPFFLIPATFKYGLGVFGNLGGMINDKSRGFFDKQRKRRQEKYGFIGNKASNYSTAKRADWTSRLQSNAEGKNAFTRRAMGAAGSVIGGYNIQARASAAQASVAKEIKDQIATGDDTEVRALTARKFTNDDGTTEWRTLTGKKVDEAAVNRAKGRWGNDFFAQQAALSYEMSKASKEHEIQNVANGYTDLAKNQWKMTDNQATSAWIGAAFENQNSHLEYKQMRARTETDEKGNTRIIAADANGGGGMALGRGAGSYDAFVDEIYDKRGSYNMAQMGSNTVEELKQAYAHAADVHREATAEATAAQADPSLSQQQRDAATRTAQQKAQKAQDRQQKLAAIAETFMHESGRGGTVGQTEDGVPISVPGSGGTRQASTPGAAHVAERVRELAVLTGVYNAPPSGTYSSPDHSPTPNNREQK